MARTQTMVQLSDILVAALDAEAERRQVSRSAVIREAVAAHVSADLEATIGAQIAEGYQRRPQGVPDTWGDLATTADTETEAALRRLDAEDGGIPQDARGVRSPPPRDRVLTAP